MNNLFGTRNYLASFSEIHHDLQAWKILKITVFEYFQVATKPILNRSF
jgi:hypothetical protein